MYYLKILDKKIKLHLQIHEVYKYAYELKQLSNDHCKIEIWQNIDGADIKLCTIIKKANPPTKNKKKYDRRTGISFYSEI